MFKLSNRIIRNSIVAVVCLSVAALCISTAGTKRNEHIDYEQFFDINKGVPSSDLVEDGNKALLSGSPDSALIYYTLVARRYLLNPKEKDVYAYARARNNSGYTYFFKYSDYQQAYANYIDALETSLQYGFDDLLPMIYTNIANIYYIYGQKDQALDFYRKGFAAAIKTQNKEMILKSMNNMSLCFFDHYSAESIKDELDIFYRQRLPRDSDVITTKLLADAVRLVTKGDTCSAVLRLDSAAEFAKDRTKIAVLSSRGLLNSKIGNYKSGLKDYKLIEPYTTLPGNADILAGYLQQMSGIFSKLGNIDSAYYYSSRYMEISDSIFGVSGFGKLKDLEAANSARKADEKFRELQESNRKMIWVLATVITILMLLGIIIMLLVRGRNVLRRSNAELFRKNEELISESANVRDWMKAYEGAMSVKQIEPTAIADEDLQRLRNLAIKICAIFDESPDVYSYDFSIDTLAALTSSTRQNVSLALNRILEKTFPQILGETRIKEACRRLSDRENYNNLTLEGLASSCGFRSRTNFISVFKKVTGLTPSQYRNMAEDRNEADVSD